MKSLNDIEISGALGARPQRSEVNNPRVKSGKDLRLHFPLVWTQNGLTSVIVVTAIGESARAIEQHALPGEPLFITGSLSKYQGATRCKMISSARLTGAGRTTEVQGPRGPLLSLEGGNADVRVRGHITEDSRVVHGVYLSTLSVRNKDNEYVEHYTISATQPMFAGQAVSVTGDFQRLINQEETEAVIVARHLRIGEQLIGPASMTNRDPQDRLRMHRLRPQDQSALSNP
ncbi:hypothetical protein IHN32_01835 [Deinococcus sp. 14RED07]|uniref:hypothetical protein n=1 Tax=Deinococcus sp. 14RED07 TaxID=2745874 RepID=UPI001E4FADB7|nr:hypothetical protein [Deinococcus sp. 14RED07]MCD0174694.1 hypothetical protein [Deinococcus sp. 14RED07]